MDATDHSTVEILHLITCSESHERIMQRVNLFHPIDVGSQNVVSYVLPNFPETHEVIGGAETAGSVVNFDCSVFGKRSDCQIAISGTASTAEHA